MPGEGTGVELATEALSWLSNVTTAFDSSGRLVQERGPRRNRRSPVSERAGRRPGRRLHQRLQHPRRAGARLGVQTGRSTVSRLLGFEILSGRCSRGIATSSASRRTREDHVLLTALGGDPRSSPLAATPAHIGPSQYWTKVYCAAPAAGGSPYTPAASLPASPTGRSDAFGSEFLGRSFQSRLV